MSKNKELSGAAKEEWSWNFRFLNLLIITTLVRIIFGALAELKYEEAYYWMYSQNLDWSYFDHPPLIGWLIFLSCKLGGDAEIWVRLPAILCFAGTLFFIHRLACDLFGARIGFITAVLASLLPAFEWYSIFTLPDAPLLLFWSLVMCVGYRLYEDEKPLWWLVIGAATGLAMLSKYPGILAPLAPVLIIAFKKKYHLFKCWQFYAGIALCWLIFSPVIYWNSQHEWASFLFQGVSRFFEANSWLDIVGGSLLNITALPTPFGFLLLLWVAWQSLKRAQTDERWFYLVCAFLPFAFIIVAVAVCRLVQLNWPLPIYPALIIATAAVLDEVRAWYNRKWQFVLGAVFIPAVIFSLLPLIAVVWIITPLNRFNEIYGWKHMGQTVLEMVSANPNPKKCFIAGHDYQTASEAAYYTKLPRLTVASNLYGQRSKGFDYWSQQNDYQGWNCVYVVTEELHSNGQFRPRHEFNLDELRKHFDSVDPSGNRLTVYRGGSPVRRYRFYYGINYRGIPLMQGQLAGEDILEEIGSNSKEPTANSAGTAELKSSDNEVK
ncbi:MAG: ArnT family glycosyltransferase [Candidatus Bruticola sp.]